MLRPIRVVIVDDESLGRERIRQLLQDHGNVEIVGECENGLQAVEAIEHLSPDLVFLDVQMPELDGIEVLTMLGDSRVPEVIFTTAYAEYMEQAFEAHAIDFLRKPYRETRFQDALDHAKQRIHARRSLPSEEHPRIRALLAQIVSDRAADRLKIAVKNGLFRLVPTDEVTCLEADADYVKVHTHEETILWRMTMKRAGESLDPEKFLRVHRSFIVNTTCVRKVSHIGKGEYFFELEGGRKVGTGRSYREAVEAFLNT
ncbi:MAG: response regulator [Gemmatimonas sp.]|nr:response regulator [Gemmatimonas sp.]